MKKLSVKASLATSETRRLNKRPIALSYDETGSYLVLDNGFSIRGTCINCQPKPCLEYNASELNASFFTSFPHNTSKRVCPTKALLMNADNNSVRIDDEKCIACGLCIHRCPVAAIQLDLSKSKVFVNNDESILEHCTLEQQVEFSAEMFALPHQITISSIPATLGDNYQEQVLRYSKEITDLGEIIVRNTLVNMGIPTNAKAKGNNHNRIEFFGQQGNNIIIGETNCDNTDVLTISRRILDDEAVMISRHNKEATHIVPLSVINGFPNKRTDYYEVIYDINNVLNVSISTITFYVLFILNLFDKKLSVEDFKEFSINRFQQDITPAVKIFIPEIEHIDLGIASSNYSPIK